MLYYISQPEIQMLIAAFLAVMVYSAILSVFVNANLIMRSLLMAAVFMVSYLALITSGTLLGKPAWRDEEKVGQLGGYVTFDHDGLKWIAILLRTENGPELIATPHTPEDDRQLQDSMSRWMKTGQGQIVRKPPRGSKLEPGDREGNGNGNRTNDGSGGELEFYEFNDQFLQPKDPQ